MKIVEIEINREAVQLPINNEEFDLLNKFKHRDEIQRQDLAEREVHVANQLVNKDVLYRKNQHGRVTYHKKT